MDEGRDHRHMVHCELPAHRLLGARAPSRGADTRAMAISRGRRDRILLSPEGTTVSLSELGMLQMQLPGATSSSSTLLTSAAWLTSSGSPTGASELPRTCCNRSCERCPSRRDAARKSPAGNATRGQPHLDARVGHVNDLSSRLPARQADRPATLRGLSADVDPVSLRT
jgi:hypothetical protein